MHAITIICKLVQDTASRHESSVHVQFVATEPILELNLRYGCSGYNNVTLVVEGGKRLSSYYSRDMHQLRSKFHAQQLSMHTTA